METRIEIVAYRGSTSTKVHTAGCNSSVSAGGIVACYAEDREGFVISASTSTDVAEFGIDFVLTFPNWKNEYLLVPGAIYDGNRFRVLNAPYPPIYGQEETEDTTPVTTDIPRLPSIHLLSGDASYPAIGFWNPEDRIAQAILFPAITNLGYTGLKIEEGSHGLTIRIQFPGVRPQRYAMVETNSPSTDHGALVQAGWTMETQIAIVSAETANVSGLFALLDANRHRCVAPPTRQALRPLSSAAELVTDVTMSSRWIDDPGFFETADSDHGIPFQVGWTGGGITSFAMLESSDQPAQRLARRNVDFVCESLQAPSGFFYGGYRNGPTNDGFGHPHAEHWGMVRKSGDMLLFLIRHILSLQASGEVVPPLWMTAAHRCAEAFLRNGDEWGQFVDVRTGRVVIRGSACGGTAIAGLTLASTVFDEPRFLKCAQAAGKRYATECIQKGLLTGGPGEILKAPDSESAFGLLEGYIVLWEATSDPRWIFLACQTASQAASWVVPYDFPFPPESTFGRMDMRTTGTVIANAQNKHSAPGICTGSALPLLKLFRATGERRWLDLAVDISHALPQYVSSAERPIVADDGSPMPAGWVNERVNMSDWEAPRRGPGEIVYGPCWSMTSVLLTALEMPGVYVDPTNGIVACADHVEASIAEGKLYISNPTAYDARVSVLIDSAPSQALGELWWRQAEHADIPAHGFAEMALHEETNESETVNLR